MKEMKKGDHAFFYHTGDEKQVVGIVEVIREAYPDPTDEKGVFKSLDVKAVKPLPEAGDAGGGQGRCPPQGHGAGQIRPALGAAGHAAGMEDHLRDGEREGLSY